MSAPVPSRFGDSDVNKRQEALVMSDKGKNRAASDTSVYDAGYTSANANAVTADGAVFTRGINPTPFNHTSSLSLEATSRHGINLNPGSAFSGNARPTLRAAFQRSANPSPESTFDQSATTPPAIVPGFMPIASLRRSHPDDDDSIPAKDIMSISDQPGSNADAMSVPLPKEKNKYEKSPKQVRKITLGKNLQKTTLMSSYGLESMKEFLWKQGEDLDQYTRESLLAKARDQGTAAQRPRQAMADKIIEILRNHSNKGVPSSSHSTAQVGPIATSTHESNPQPIATGNQESKRAREEDNVCNAEDVLPSKIPKITDATTSINTGGNMSSANTGVIVDQLPVMFVPTLVKISSQPSQGQGPPLLRPGELAFLQEYTLSLRQICNDLNSLFDQHLGEIEESSSKTPEEQFEEINFFPEFETTTPVVAHETQQIIRRIAFHSYRQVQWEHHDLRKLEDGKKPEGSGGQRNAFSRARGVYLDRLGAILGETFDWADCIRRTFLVRCFMMEIIKMLHAK